MKPIIHEVASSSECGIDWADPATWAKTSSTIATEAVMGSSLAEWGCDQVSSMSPIWRNDATGVSYALEMPEGLTVCP